jgi:hypothetical protein
MNPVSKLAAFLAILSAVFGVAYLTGTRSQAVIAPVAVHRGPSQFGGLAATGYGYTLWVPDPTADPGQDQFVEFMITGPDGKPVSRLLETDGARMHMIAIRSDLTGYQHIYPEQNAGASWWAALNLTPGSWRLVVDFRPTAALGREIVLGTELRVSGNYRASQLAAPADRVAVDGFVATLSGGLSTYGDRELSVDVTARDGQPVTDLVLAHGTLGHAVLIRPGDLGYLHLHANPVVVSDRGPRITFSSPVPEPGSFVVFVEFSRAEATYLAPFTVTVTR